MSRTEETRAVVERFIIGGEKDFPVTDSKLAVFKTNLRALFEELVHPTSSFTASPEFNGAETSGTTSTKSSESLFRIQPPPST